MTGLVHIVAATFRADASSEAVAAATERARALRAAPEVMMVLIGRSDESLVVATWLPSREALDPFAASAEQMSFVMQGLAPAIRGMWSAAVETDAPPPTSMPASIWVFALPEREGVYEWQVRDLLADLEALPGAAAGGPTVEERERFRAGGVITLDADELDFGTRLDALRAQWTEVLGPIEETLVPVLSD